MKLVSRGGYDDGYMSTPCFWGRSPGSLVKLFLARTPEVAGLKILDLGCGEGKNASAFAEAGAKVTAVDCSKAALENGRRAFSSSRIDWIEADAIDYLVSCTPVDVVVMYGLLHCLTSVEAIEEAIALSLSKTRPGGHHIVVAFNDGPHDLTAHPGFTPTLMSHRFFLEQYSDTLILIDSDSKLYETHPHNGISHFHSLTRLIARIRQ